MGNKANRSRKYPHSKLIEGTSDGGLDGRPVIDDDDPLLSALFAKHPEKKPDDAPSMRCPRCTLISYNPNDVRYRYCGNCHKFHSDMREG